MRVREGEVMPIPFLFRVWLNKSERSEYQLLHVDMKDGVIQLMSEDLCVLDIEADEILDVITSPSSGGRPRIDWDPDGVKTYGMRTTHVFKEVVLDPCDTYWREFIDQLKEEGDG